MKCVLIAAGLACAVVGIQLFGIPPTNASATGDAPTLLESFAFLLRGIEVHETSAGLIETKNGEVNWIWRVEDLSNCIIRIDHVNPVTGGRGWQRFYLNNVLPRYATGRQAPSRNWLNGDMVGGDYYIRLNGDDAVRCEFNLGDSPNQTICNKELYLYAPSSEVLDRIQRDLEYIYGKFCTNAKYEKPF